MMMLSMMMMSRGKLWSTSFLRSVTSSELQMVSIIRIPLHTSAVTHSKERKPPQRKSDYPSDKSSLGKLVSRGMKVEDAPEQYTVKPMKVLKTGGRGTDGRIEIRRIGGGKPVFWHMADLVRIAKDEADPKVEIVRDIIDEQTRSSYLALVIGGEKKRWIIATDNMRVGDVITSTRDLPLMPIQAQPGDSHPVGALPIGTQVCCVERFPHTGSRVANAAGTSAIIVRKSDDMVTLRMPSKREMIVHERCQCVVGRVSNTERNKIDLGKAGASRWLGIRPKSGLWMKKTGLAGRKIKPTPKPAVFTKEHRSKTVWQTFTVPKRAFERMSDYKPTNS